MFKNLPQSRVLRQLARLNLIQGTPATAFRFGPHISKVELVLVQKNIHHPAIGLRKFWRNNLPTLKFHNDDVSFVVTRVSVQNKEEAKQCPIKIVVHDKNNNTQTINCAHMNESKILSKLVKATEGKSVEGIEEYRLKEVSY